MTEPLQPYRPAHSTRNDEPEEYYDWEYDEQPRDRPKVLWGRVAILGALVLAAFLLGRITKSGGIPESRLTAANERVTELEQEVADLETELAAVPVAPPADTTTDETTDPAAEEEDTTTDVATETYVVKPNDTLTIIAEKVYGDASLDDFLAEANNIADPTALSVGQELIIPEKPAE
ncbi:MAG TPA: LysM peptidoglycan-binding domain-containing protein [Actinomycetota bacterium]|nr:LysM peptidoglycan-binding domain-containing protein [Actinomycetota bacterium]